MSIGEVLGALRPDFPDVTISKIRFLESEGLVEPQRTASGYRKFSHEDLDRLRYVLTAQRDHYLPLRVIKDHLDAIDRGLEPPELAGTGPRVPRAVRDGEGLPSAESFVRRGGELRLSRAELLEASGLDEPQLVQVESYGLLAPRTGSGSGTGGTGHYDADALAIARTVAELAAFGLEPRHLRPFKTAADREIGLVEQVIGPMLRQRGPEARARAEETARELAALSVRLHAALVKAGLQPGLNR
ncbi:MAG: transcriptional regulator FtsR [Motilibacteraceae bacterium]